MTEQEESEDDFSDFPPPGPDETRLDISSEPDPREAFLTINDKPLWLKGDLAIITGQGGVSKGQFLTALAYQCAKGGRIGPIKATRELEVLAVFAEDPIEEIKRRFYYTSNPRGEWPESLHVVSTMGRVGPIIGVDQHRRAEKTVWYDWYSQMIENHMPLDIVFLDPKSRIAALPENEAHLAQFFIDCMDEWIRKYNIGIMFAHHTNKASVDNEDFQQSMIRGSDAIAAGCRLGFGMKTPGKNKCKELEIKNEREFVLLDTIKSNYVAPFKEPLLFQRGDHGALVYENQKAQKREKALDTLYRAIKQHNGEYSKRDIEKGLNGSGCIINTMALNGSTVTAKYTVTLLDHLLKKNLLIEEEVKKEGSKKPKKVLKFVPRDTLNLNQA